MVHRWPWGVVAVSKRTGKVVGWWFPGLTRWYAWCDCGWEATRKRRRPAATALANHTHLPPRKESARG